MPAIDASPFSPTAQRIRCSTTEPTTPARTRGGLSSCAQFTLDADDRILNHRIAEGDRWLFRHADLTGRSLRALLAECDPVWSARLPDRLAGDETPLFLPDAPGGLAGLGIAIHRLRAGETTSVALTPELAPPSELHQCGLSDLTADNANFARLFLRLRAAESRLEHYVAHLPGVVFHQRADQSFAVIGGGFATLTGLSPDPLHRNGQAFLKLIHEDDEIAFHREIARHADATKPFSLVYRIRNPRTETTVYLLDVRSPVRTASGLLLGHEGVWLDITRQKIAEHRLTSRGWKESLATLTSGLLHDFSNVMTGIHSLSELYHDSLPPEHPLHEGLGLIRDNSSQGQHLLRRIIDLNRENTDEKTYADLAHLVRDQADLLKILLPRGTRLTLPADDLVAPVFIDETAFRQVLVNFAMNSRDALRGPGDIRIGLRLLHDGEPPVGDTQPPLKAVRGAAVEFTFSDNGSGIPAQHIARIFDPFFTTKDVHRGSGLGLYNVRLFAEDHGGAIAVRSHPGEGTDLVLVLPQADLSVTHTGLDDSAAASAGPTRRPRVLYLEPDMTDEDALVEELRAREWEVRTVATVEHFRRHLREESLRLDLIFVRQPQVDATLRDLIATIRREHPGLPIAATITGEDPEELGKSFRTQIDLLVPADFRDRDAADALASRLRLT